MNIFFDVDDTILCAGLGTLRPHVREVFQWLKDDGHNIYIWSGVGLRTAEVRRFGLEPFVSNIFVKPLADYRNEARRLGVQPYPDYCIDDHQGVIEAFGGFWVRDYPFPNENDTEMLRVYEAIQEFVRDNAH